MPEEVVKVYDLIAKKYAETFSGRNKFMDNFSRMLKKGATVMDLGCGPGDDTKYLLLKGFRVTSIDASKKMLEIARRKVPGHEFVMSDMRKIKYRNNSFDGISCAFSLIHIKKNEAIKLIKKFRDLLKENGVLYLALQEGEGEKFVTEPFDSSKKIFFSFYTKAEINKILRENGFKIILMKITSAETELELQNDKLFVIARKVK